MGRDVVYEDALADLESDIAKKVHDGDDEALSDAVLAKRWESYRKGKDLAYYPSRTLELLHRDQRLIRGVMGPVGCLAGGCRIYTEHGLVRLDTLYRRGKPFRVYSMRKDGSIGLELATAPFVKGCEPLVRVDLENGGSFRGAMAHRMLTASGFWVSLEHTFSGSRLLSAEVVCQQGFQQREPSELTVDLTHTSALGVVGCSVPVGCCPEVYYDLTVESTGNYIGEWGIIHHNSGKTYGIVADMNMRHFHQRPCKDGIVRDRFSLIRGTLTLLKATLVDTWMSMFPSTVIHGSKYGVFGNLTRVRSGTTYNIELRGFGLDKAGALANMLSNNFSGCLINEAVTISEAAKDHAAGRCGRFPDQLDAPPGFEKMKGAYLDKDGYWRWFLNHGVSMDTNAASEDSWWYRKSKDGDVNPELEVYFDQPPAAFKVWNDELEKWEYELNKGQRPGVPHAENIEHLLEHWDYYRNIIGSSSHRYISRYVLCEYSKTEVGDPVFSDFSDRWHIAKNGVPWPRPGTRLFGGMDFGQTRRVVIGYLAGDGRLMVCAEAVDPTGSVETFANNVLRPLLAQHGFSPSDLTLYCDPAGMNRSEHSEIGAIYLMRMCGFEAMPPAKLVNNDVNTRLESVRHYLTRIIGSKGAVQIDPSCVDLVRSIGGGYVWARRKVGVEYMNMDIPSKNNHSHIADAFQYFCCGMRWGGDAAKVASMGGRGYREMGGVYMPLWEKAGAVEESSLC